MKKIALLTLTLLATGCASYNAISLAALSPQFCKEFKEVEGVSIGCKKLSEEECYTYLDRPMQKNGYETVQVTFYNKSDKSYVFSKANIGLPCAPLEEVTKKAHTSTVGRFAGYLAGALVITPLIIPAIVDTIRSHSANIKLDKDFCDKSESQFIVGPGSYKVTLLFVPKEKLPPLFDLTLIEQDTGDAKTVKLAVF